VSTPLSIALGISSFAFAFDIVSCSPASDVTASTNKYETDFIPAYNPKNLKQCVAACIKCQNGVTTTCALKGALVVRLQRNL
jgi:hypothetical protein